jgi:serine/threonine-protein kinase HipA
VNALVAWIRCVFNIAPNCDDHTKNLAFIMDEMGQWRLSPAYDVCFSHNPAPDKWTRQHQMLVAGKGHGITRGDLLELGSKFGVNQPKVLFEKVIDAVRQWPYFARKAEVAHIAAYQELL